MISNLELESIRNEIIRDKKICSKLCIRFRKVGYKQLQWFEHAKRMLQERIPTKMLE